ncbi:MAG TPA: discoidin domain-containing protein [Oculatellaceae cyanobacterium]
MLDVNGAPICRGDWSIAYVDSEECIKEDGSAENAINGQTSDFWHTEPINSDGKTRNHPHELVIDLGSEQKISGMRYTPISGASNARIEGYRVYIGNDITTSRQP